MNTQNLSDAELAELVKALPDDAFSDFTVEQFVAAYMQAFEVPEAVQNRMAELLNSGRVERTGDWLRDLEVSHAQAEREFSVVTTH